MKAYLIYSLSQMEEMTLEEIKVAKDKFELWTKSTGGPKCLCWFEYGTDGNEVWRVGVTEEGDEELHRVRIPENPQSLFGECIDLTGCTPDRTFLFEK